MEYMEIDDEPAAQPAAHSPSFQNNSNLVSNFGGPSVTPPVSSEIRKSALPGSKAVRFVLEEVVKDASNDSSRYEAIIPPTAVKVHTAMTSVVTTSCRLATRCKRQHRIQARDVDRAIQIEFGRSPVFFSSGDTAVVESEFCSVKEQDILLSDFITNDVPILKKVPAAPTFRLHWLAIEGQQPLIPENDFSKLDALQQVATTSRKQLQKKTDQAGPDSETATLTKEFQLYYDKITLNLVKGEGDHDAATQEKCRTALAAVELDAGIERLVPHFIRFISNHIAKNSQRLASLWSAVNLAAALIRNEHLKNVDLYLHELLPNLLNCVLAKTLSEGPSDNHWALRDYSARLLAEICSRFGTFNTSIKRDIVEIYSEALITPNRPLTTIYGGVVGLGALGDDIVDDVLGRLLVRGEFLLKLLQVCEDDSYYARAPTMVAFERRVEALAVVNAIRTLFSRQNIELWPILDILGYEWPNQTEFAREIFI